MLSYDWIKILLVIVAAVVALTVFFTMVGTRPGRYQVFEVYGYSDLSSGADSATFADRLKTGGVFSYDILNVEAETFDSSNYYGNVTYSARRTAGQGKVMFTTNRKTGNEADPEETYLMSAAGVGRNCVALDLTVYLNDCQNYLVRFFGDNWEENELDKEEAEKCFMRRNGKDKRYNYSYSSNREKGIEDEYARLERLRADYIFLEKKIAEGVITLVSMPDGADGEQVRAFGLGNLADLADLYYYTDEEGKPSTKEICLLIFDNDNDEGREAAWVENDLRYEPISFLRFLVETYG